MFFSVGGAGIVPIAPEMCHNVLRLAALGQEREVGEWRRVVREDLAADPAEQDSGGSSGSSGGRRSLLFPRGRKRKREGGGGGGGSGGGGDTERGGGETGGKTGGLASAWVEDMGGYLSLPEVEISSAEEFMSVFVNKSRPAVIKVTRPAGGLFCSGLIKINAGGMDALAPKGGLCSRVFVFIIIVRNVGRLRPTCEKVVPGGLS